MQNAKILTLSSVFTELLSFLIFFCNKKACSEHISDSNETGYIDRRLAEEVQSARTVSISQ